MPLEFINLTAEAAQTRTEQSFLVPREEIAANAGHSGVSFIQRANR